MKTLIEQFRAARRAGTPLVAIETPDPAATIQTIIKGMNGKNPPFLQWDIVRGLVGLNENGTAQLGRLGLAKDDVAQQTINPTEMLALITKLGGESIVFMHNAHRFVESEGVAQATWNLRDIFKGRLNTLVMLAPSIKLPSELERDVIVLDEPLPDDAALGAIAETVQASAAQALVDLKPMTIAQRTNVVRAARGLSAFAAEQAIYMSVSKAGIDIDDLWERKRKMIEQTKGLQVYNGGESFDAIGGIARIKEFAGRLFNGSNPPTAVVWIDEIEKAMAGTGSVGDSSGTSQDQLGVLLNAMNDNEWAGQIAIGPPGCAKSLYAKSLAATHNVPCIKLDLGAMKGSLVGQSEAQIRAAIKIIVAVAGKGAYWVATCNQLDSLKPELRRRFTDSVWYFDLPTDDERATIWSLLRNQFNVPLSDTTHVEDYNWTGADIRNTCSIASRLRTTLKDAATYITPVATCDPRAIEKLRELANNAFLSASVPGVYRRSEDAVPATARSLSF